VSETILRVLALDDEYLVALDVELLLSAYKWIEVQVAASDQIGNADALADCDLVLLDPQSPRIDAAALEGIRRRIPMVFGMVEPYVGASAGERDSPPQILKPYSVLALLKAMAEALEPYQPSIARKVMAEVEGSGP
jgi:DNA-binding NarL/FixJ family response regulator